MTKRGAGQVPRKEPHLPDETDQDHSKFLKKLEARCEWHAVNRPRSWRPKEVGETFIGVFGAIVTREGAWGPYPVAAFHVPGTKEITIISGILLINRLRTNLIPTGTLLRIKWCGYKELSDERRIRQFEVEIGLEPDEV